jgi:hypothetical protein
MDSLEEPRQDESRGYLEPVIPQLETVEIVLHRRRSFSLRTIPAGIALDL